MQRRGLSAWSIKHAWSPLRLVLRYAVRHYGLPGNPADALLPTERPKPGEDRKRFLNRKEIGLLLDAAEDPFHLPIATAIFSGLRIGELLGLTWDDVDFKAGVIKVRFQATRPGERARLKTPAARRDVILMPELGSDLRRHRLASPWARPQDIVFASKTGTSPDQRNVANRGLKIACRAAGLEGVSFHVLRHTFASILIAQGHDVVFVSRQLGHANAAITLKGLCTLVRRGATREGGAAAAGRGLPSRAAAAREAGAAARIRRVIRSAGDAHRRRRQHRQQLVRQRLARTPELETDDLSCRRVEVAQAPGRLLGHDGAAVVALEAQPGDVGVAVVVAVDLHSPTDARRAATR
jgi:integrase